MSTTRLDLLLVHENAAVEAAIERDLAEAGFARLVLAATGREAVSVLQRTPVDGVLCSVHLGDVDAWRLTRMIRSGRFVSPAVPVIALCDRADMHALAALAKDHRIILLGPLRGDAMRAAVADAVHGRVKTRLLIVEDNIPAAESARLALEKDYDVEVQHDGKAGLQAWRERRHDLVLLDLQLPYMSGSEVLVRMRELDPTQCVVILTAYADPERHADLVLSGAAEFLAKPLDPTTLRQTCDAVLRERELLRGYEHAQSQEQERARLARAAKAADYSLSQGRAHHALTHIRSALAHGRVDSLTDDEWSKMLAEVE